MVGAGDPPPPYADGSDAAGRRLVGSRFLDRRSTVACPSSRRARCRSSLVGTSSSAVVAPQRNTDLINLSRARNTTEQQSGPHVTPRRRSHARCPEHRGDDRKPPAASVCRSSPTRPCCSTATSPRSSPKSTSSCSPPRRGCAGGDVPRARPWLSPERYRGSRSALGRGSARSRRGQRTARWQDGQLQGPHRSSGYAARVRCAPLERFIPYIDATIITRVLALAARSLASTSWTASPEGSVSATRGDFGRPLNPHDTAHYTGGSSSGSAVALATGEVDISFGGDQGGSIRIPAAWCGVVGLEADVRTGVAFRRRLRLRPEHRLHRPDGRACRERCGCAAGNGGLRRARSAPDAATSRTPSTRCRELDGGVKGLRIGVLEEGFEGPLNLTCVMLVMAAVSEFEAAGAEVTKISFPAPHRRIAQTAMSPEGSLGMKQVGVHGAFSTYYPTSIITAVHRHEPANPDARRRAPNSAAQGESRAPQLRRRRVRQGSQRSAGDHRAPSTPRSTDVDLLVMPTCVTVARVTTIRPRPLDAARCGSTWRRSRRERRAEHQPSTTPASAIACRAARRRSDQHATRRVSTSLVCGRYAYQQRVDWDEITSITPTNVTPSARRPSTGPARVDGSAPARPPLGSREFVGLMASCMAMVGAVHRPHAPGVPGGARGVRPGARLDGDVVDRHRLLPRPRLRAAGVRAAVGPLRPQAAAVRRADDHGRGVGRVRRGPVVRRADRLPGGLGHRGRRATVAGPGHGPRPLQRRPDGQDDVA